MGLAATQARLLTITARKADCEFMSMTLSHQKLALSRNMEKVSDEYQNALMATKLVYDYQSTGLSDMNLTYDLLMNPSIYNDYYPKMVTDAQNRCILNSAYAAAARAAGIPAEGLIGTPSSDVRNKFIQALANNNVITSYSAASIQAVTYNNTVGFGTTISATAGTEEISYEQLLNYLKTTQSSADYGFTLAMNYEQVCKDAYNDVGTDKYGQNVTVYYPSRLGDGERLWVVDGDNTNKFSGGSTSQTINLADLLNPDKNYIYGIHTARAHSGPVQDAAYLQYHLVGDQYSFLNWMDDQFYSILGGASSQSDLALQYAYDAIYDLIYPNSNIMTYVENGVLGKNKQNRADATGDDKNNGVQKMLQEIGTVWHNNDNDVCFDTVMNQADDHIGIYAKQGDADEGDYNSISIDLSSLAQIYLTAYVEYMQGVENTNYRYDIGKRENANLFDGNEDDFTFTIASESTIDDGGSDMNAQFYDALFNLICLNGWTENPQIDDSEYMTEMMKNGMAFISSISDDGYYYQSSYSNDKTILEVTDNEAIAQAEARYNAEKSKIENKENSLDLRMKNLDTEISSLDQEYNTVKSLISKTIEKSIKRYEA